MAADDPSATTRTQQAAHALRRMILQGELGPGEKLQAQRLADRLQVSRTPINEALAILASEGLLEYGVNRGYAVKRFGLKTFMDAYEARQVLEGLACRLVAERGLSDETRLSLEDNLVRTEEALFGGPWTAAEQEQWRILNFQFHDLLLAEADNGFITEGVAAARAQPLIFNHAFGDALTKLWPQLDLRHSRQSCTDHLRIADAIFARQAARAENMMREHIFAGREKGREIMSSIDPALFG